MAGYSAISDVSNDLVNVLRAGMVDPGPPEMTIVDDERVGLGSPSDPGTLLLSVYLYQVTESSHLKNADRREVDATRYGRPPLALDLHYLLTAHPANEQNGESESRDPHLVLGRAMQILHDAPVLGGATTGVDGDRSEETARPSVSMYPRSLDELTNVWSAFQEGSLLPSVSYLVTPVLIDSTRRETVHRVMERHLGRPPAREGEE